MGMNRSNVHAVPGGQIGHERADGGSAVSSPTRGLQVFRDACRRRGPMVGADGEFAPRIACETNS